MFVYGAKVSMNILHLFAANIFIPDSKNVKKNWCKSVPNIENWKHSFQQEEEHGPVSILGLDSLVFY